MEDVGWKKPRQEDPLTRLLVRASREVQNGAICGFFVGLALGLAAVALALTVHKAFWLATLGSLMVGLIGGAITGKLIEIRRAWRLRARRCICCCRNSWPLLPVW